MKRRLWRCVGEGLKDSMCVCVLKKAGSLTVCGVQACMREYTKAWEEGGFDAQWSQDAAFMLDKSHAYVRAFVARDVAAARIARDPSKVRLVA